MKRINQGVSWTGAVKLGLFTPKLKSYVLTNYAYGYDLANWSSSNLKTNKKVI